jgi:hypothetical protein
VDDGLLALKAAILRSAITLSLQSARHGSCVVSVGYSRLASSIDLLLIRHYLTASLLNGLTPQFYLAGSAAPWPG